MTEYRREKHKMGKVSGFQVDGRIIYVIGCDGQYIDCIVEKSDGPESVTFVGNSKTDS